MLLCRYLLSNLTHFVQHSLYQGLLTIICLKSCLWIAKTFRKDPSVLSLARSPSRKTHSSGNHPILKSLTELIHSRFVTTPTSWSFVKLSCFSVCLIELEPMVRKYDEIDFLEAVLEIKRSKVSCERRRSLCTLREGPPHRQPVPECNAALGHRYLSEPLLQEVRLRSSSPLLPCVCRKAPHGCEHVPPLDHRPTWSKRNVQLFQTTHQSVVDLVSRTHSSCDLTLTRETMTAHKARFPIPSSFLLFLRAHVREYVSAKGVSVATSVCMWLVNCILPGAKNNSEHEKKRMWVELT